MHCFVRRAKIGTRDSTKEILAKDGESLLTANLKNLKTGNCSLLDQSSAREGYLLRTQLLYLASILPASYSYEEILNFMQREQRINLYTWRNLPDPWVSRRNRWKEALLCPLSGWSISVASRWSPNGRRALWERNPAVIVGSAVIAVYGNARGMLTSKVIVLVTRDNYRDSLLWFPWGTNASNTHCDSFRVIVTIRRLPFGIRQSADFTVLPLERRRFRSRFMRYGRNFLPLYSDMNQHRWWSRTDLAYFFTDKSATWFLTVSRNIKHNYFAETCEPSCRTWHKQIWISTGRTFLDIQTSTVLIIHHASRAMLYMHRINNSTFIKINPIKSE